MSDRREEILKSCIVSGSIGNGEVHCEIQEAKNAMDENAKRMCLELLEYMANSDVKCTWYDHPVNGRQYVFKYKGCELTKQQLFENFL